MRCYLDLLYAEICIFLLRQACTLNILGLFTTLHVLAEVLQYLVAKKRF